MQLKRYIERAEKINKVELNQLRKPRKLFGGFKPNNTNSNAGSVGAAGRQTTITKVEEKQAEQQPTPSETVP